MTIYFVVIWYSTIRISHNTPLQQTTDSLSPSSVEHSSPLWYYQVMVDSHQEMVQDWTWEVVVVIQVVIGMDVQFLGGIRAIIQYNNL
jgi:hypothetical protein